MLNTINRKDSFNKDALLLYILPTLAVLLAMLTISFWAWTTAKQNYTNNRARVVSEDVTKLQNLFTGRLRSYEDILRGGAGLFDGSKTTVTNDQWKAFIASYDIQKRYPGINSIGYVSVQKPEALQQFIAEQQITNTPDFTVHPAGERALYSAVTNVEPHSDVNNEVIGYDLSLIHI